MFYKELINNLAEIKKNIELSCVKAGRNSNSVKIVAATKGQSVEKINSVIANGIKFCGENYVKEAEKKINEIGNRAEWHFIGHLQSNKVKKAVEIFDCIQTLDSVKLAKKIDGIAEKPFPVLIEVNIGKEKSKFGISPENVFSFYNSLNDFHNLNIKGLFCLAPFVSAEQAREHFQLMKQLNSKLCLSELSMGMSNDYFVAIEEGSTMIRIGTALFGERK